MALEKGQDFLEASHEDCHHHEQFHGTTAGAEAGGREEHLDTQEI